MGFNAVGGVERRRRRRVADVSGGQVLNHSVGFPVLNRHTEFESERRRSVYAVTLSVTSVVGVEVLVCAVVTTETELAALPDAL